MTPQEKAKELVNKFLQEVFSGDYQPTSFSLLCAKQCALISVDEALSNGSLIERGDRSSWWKYYQEVKSEINKL